MNKKELTAIHEVTGSYDDYVNQRNEAFKTLQEELKQRGIHPTCSLEGNVKTLAALGEKETDRALVLYRRYWEADAKLWLISMLGLGLANADGHSFSLGCPPDRS